MCEPDKEPTPKSHVPADFEAVVRETLLHLDDDVEEQMNDAAEQEAYDYENSRPMTDEQRIQFREAWGRNAE